MYFHIACVFLLMQAATSISIASTSSPYTNQATEESYASSTVEPASSPYKIGNQYAHSRQFEPLFTPNSQYVESLTAAPSSPATPKQFLFHRFPFFNSFNSPYQQPPVYDAPGYPAQPPYNYPAYPPSQPLYEPGYPLAYPKYGKNPYVPDCDFHPSYRNKPFYFYPSKQDAYLDSQIIARPSNLLFRFQPPPFANNIYN